MQRPSQVRASMPDDVHASDAPDAAGPPPCAFDDGAPRVAEPRQLPRRHHPVLPRRQLRQRSMPNAVCPLSPTGRRRTEGSGLSPPRRGSAVEAGDGVCRGPRSAQLKGAGSMGSIRARPSGRPVAGIGGTRLWGFVFGTAGTRGWPRPHWIESSRTPSRASITSSPPLPMKMSLPGWPSIALARLLPIRMSGPKEPSMSSSVGERWTLWQPGIPSIQAACAGKETIRRPGWAGSRRRRRRRGRGRRPAPRPRSRRRPPAGRRRGRRRGRSGRAVPPTRPSAPAPP